jgi:hypothetical protein
LKSSHTQLLHRIHFNAETNAMIFQTTQPHISAPITACLRSCAVGLVNVANWIPASVATCVNAMDNGLMALSRINRPQLAGVNGNAGAGFAAYKERHRYDSMELTTR